MEAHARPLPRGPHGLTRDAVVASQRARMIDAIVGAVAEKGYAAATVADVVARAGVSRKTFYEHFADKEDCFLEAFDAGVETVLERIAEAAPLEPGWLGLMRARVRAYLSTLAEEAGFARTFMIEVFAAGPRALERRERVHERFQQFIKDLYEETRREAPELPEVPDAIFLAAVGGINEIVSAHVSRGRTDELPELEDTLVYLQVAMFAGHDVAARIGLEAGVAAA